MTTPHNKEAFVDQEKVTLDAPATVVNGRLFVPAKFLGDAIGFPVTFDPLTNSVTMVTATDTFVIDLAAKKVMAVQPDAEGDGAASDAEAVDAEPVEDEPLDAASIEDEPADGETGKAEPAEAEPDAEPAAENAPEGSQGSEASARDDHAPDEAGATPPASPQAKPGDQAQDHNETEAGKETEASEEAEANEAETGEETRIITELPFEELCTIVDNRLLVKLTWIADAMKVRYAYNEELRRVELLVVRTQAGAVVSPDGNSKPVARFALDKEVYRIGEPVRYIDLSYDPDAEGIAKHQWTGRQDAFFEPGRYPVTLQVTDASGNVSETYRRYIVVSDEVFLDRLHYDLYYKPEGNFIKLDGQEVKSRFVSLPQVGKNAFSPSEEKRVLLVSDSPETFQSYGILYQDEVNGKARLYANHVNGMSADARFFILATNLSEEPVTLTTTNKGEVFPSLYANVFGHNASTDFLLRDPMVAKMTIPPGESYIYVRMPDLKPGHGINAIYDVETTGNVLFTFLATDAGTVPDSPLGYVQLPYEGHVRGTFPVSDIGWRLDLENVKEPARLIIGNGVDDPFVEGFDPMRGEAVMNRGNYGVTYTIRAERPPKMAILLLARGGIFKGPFKINGEMVLAPKSGVMTAFDGVQLLKRTTGREKELVIEFTPPAASAFPVDLIFWPLEDLE